jgi:hypothetical protein
MIEAGGTNPTLATLLGIAKAVGVEPYAEVRPAQPPSGAAPPLTIISTRLRHLSRVTAA